MKNVLVPLVVAALACSGSARAREDTSRPAGREQGGDSASVPGDSARYEVVASGLEVPWALAFAPDGRLFVTERPGRIRMIRNGALEPRPWATLTVAAEGEAGLMGIAVAPDFASNGHVFVCATFRDRGRLINRVIRLTDSSSIGASPQVIVDRIPSAEFHAGDAVAFGPDGMLYVATGDARSPGSASDPQSLAGKILRYTPDGRVPSDNPTPGSPVYASGLRNVQGLAWDPATMQLFAIDHGPSGFPNERFRRNNDELNAIRGGAHYGWPSAVGPSRNPRFVDPIVTWNPGIAPAGLALYTGSVAGWRASVFVGALRGEHLRHVSLARDPATEAGWRVTNETRLFPELGRIRAVAMGPDGFVYFTSSNRDGRGVLRRDDDHVYRLLPARPR